MINFYVPTTIYNQLREIFNQKNYQRTENIEKAQIAILSYSLMKEYSKKMDVNFDVIYIALSNEDLDAFKQIENQNIDFEDLTFKENQSILKIGKIGIETRDEEIFLNENSIGLKRENIIFCYLYFTEYNRKMSPELVRDVFKVILEKIELKQEDSYQFTKRTRDSITRVFIFLKEFEGFISIEDFNRIAEIDEEEEWVKIFVNEGIFEISENQIGFKSDYIKKLNKLRQSWKELDETLKQSE